jgi:hypothetical protein
MGDLRESCDAHWLRHVRKVVVVFVDLGPAEGWEGRMD